MSPIGTVWASATGPRHIGADDGVPDTIAVQSLFKQDLCGLLASEAAMADETDRRCPVCRTELAAAVEPGWLSCTAPTCDFRISESEFTKQYV